MLPPTNVLSRLYLFIYISPDFFALLPSPQAPAHEIKTQLSSAIGAWKRLCINGAHNLADKSIITSGIRREIGKQMDQFDV